MFSQQVLQAGFQGLGALGDTPSGAALRGSIVDASLEVNFANRVVGYTSGLTQQLVSRLNSSGFKVLNIDDSALNTVTGGTVRVRVQVLTDGYGSARDAASVIAGAASYLGYNVVGFSGSLAATASGQVTGETGQTFNPATVPGAIAPAGGIGEFFSGLTSSPVSLAVVAGAAVLLLVIAKK